MVDLGLWVQCVNHAITNGVSFISLMLKSDQAALLDDGEAPASTRKALWLRQAVDRGYDSRPYSNRTVQFFAVV